MFNCSFGVQFLAEFLLVHLTMSLLSFFSNLICLFGRKNTHGQEISKTVLNLPNGGEESFNNCNLFSDPLFCVSHSNNLNIVRNF